MIDKGNIARILFPAKKRIVDIGPLENQFLGRMQMIKKSWLVIVVVGCITIGLRAQTTNVLITVVVAYSTGAVVMHPTTTITSHDFLIICILPKNWWLVIVVVG